MSKQQLIEMIAEKAGLTKADSARALEAAMESVTEALAKGEKVTLVGFCTLSVKQKDAKEGRNPKTGETVQIPARNAVKFSAGSKLKEAVNK